MWESSEGGVATPGDTRWWEGRKGNWDEPEFPQFLSISRSGPPMAGWRVCPRLSPRPRESISRVLFYLARNNFWLHRSAHKFPLGNVVQIRARRRRIACAHSSSIQLTRIELLQRTRSSSGCQMGRGGGGDRRKGEAEKRGSGLLGAQSLKGEPSSTS